MFRRKRIRLKIRKKRPSRSGRIGKSLKRKHFGSFGGFSLA